MTDDTTTPTASTTLLLTPAELDLVRTGLQLLLDAEDDGQEIEQLKTLMARLPA